MGNFSRDTFNKLKHYVGVRLQQGVPIVDADWNEQEDIRKYELQAFLKWFVGDGVPKSNDGFRILPVAGNGVNTIVLTSNRADPGSSSVVVNRAASTAADALGFGLHNYSASRTGSSPAQLTGDATEPLALADGMTLVVSTDGSPEETVTFQTGSFADTGAAMTAEVVAAINSALSNLTASAGAGNDFAIKGGDGTTDGAGRCLVEGWDVINESNLNYTGQSLYNNAGLATSWGVTSLPPLTTPGAARTDLVYLDVWEREVDAAEDSNLVNEAIGLETCVRLKREWVVRVAENAPTPPAPPGNHRYYPLARLNRAAGQAAISAAQITDLRLTELIMPSSHDVQQIVTDAYGPGYTLDQDGQPNLKVSLREAINAVLRGDLPSTPEISLVAETSTTPIWDLELIKIIVTDSIGDIWIFWYLFNHGYYYDEVEPKVWVKHYRRADDSWGPDTELIVPSPENNRGFWPNLKYLEDSDGNLWLFWQMRGEENHHVWYKRYLRSSGIWEDEARVTTASEADHLLDITLDDDGNIWVFLQSSRNDNSDIWSRRYLRSSGIWENETRITTAAESENFRQTIIDNDGNIWVFWRIYRDNNYDIWSRRYLRSSGSWENEARLTTTSESENFFQAIVDNDGNVWVFWESTREKARRIRYQRFLSANDTWEDEAQFSSNYSGDFKIITDNDGGIWVFWVSIDNSNADIRYRYYNQENNRWGSETRLTTSAEQDINPFPMVDSRGDVWVFWRSNRNGSDNIWYRRFVRTSPNTFTTGAETELTSESTYASLAQVTEDNRGDIWVFWYAANSVWYKRFSQSGGWGRTFRLSVTENIQTPEVFADDEGDLWIFWTHFVYPFTRNIMHKRLIPTI